MRERQRAYQWCGKELWAYGSSQEGEGRRSYIDRLSDSTICCRTMVIFTSGDLLLKDILKSLLYLGFPKN